MKNRTYMVRIRVRWMFVSFMLSILLANILGKILRTGTAGTSHDRPMLVDSNFTRQDEDRWQWDSPTSTNKQRAKSSLVTHKLSQKRKNNNLHLADSYFETLVHPVMFLHPEPAYVLIVAGSEREDRVLKEVLKHNTVEWVAVVVVQSDNTVDSLKEQRVDSCYDCAVDTDLLHYLDDSRVERFTEDSFDEWYDSHDNKRNRFDVIIFDQQPVGTSYVDYYDVLKESGMLILPIHNQKQSINDASIPSSFQSLVDGAVAAKFATILKYSESSSILGGLPTHFFVLAGEREGRTNWFDNEAEVNVAIRKRRVDTASSSDDLYKFFDSATMMTYQYPTSIDEELWCRQVPKPESCVVGHGFDPNRENAAASTFEARTSGVGERAGRGVFALQPINAGSYLGIDQCIDSMLVRPKAYLLLQAASPVFNELSRYWSTFEVGYIEGYGWSDDVMGEIDTVIDPGTFAFCNHGCNNTHNIGEPSEPKGVQATSDSTHRTITNAASVFNPFRDRLMPTLCNRDVVLRNLEPGEEVLDNYIALVTESEKRSFGQWITTLCAVGDADGSVYAYEHDLTGGGTCQVTVAPLGVGAFDGNEVSGSCLFDMDPTTFDSST